MLAATRDPDLFPLEDMDTDAARYAVRCDGHWLGVVASLSFPDGSWAWRIEDTCPQVVYESRNEVIDALMMRGAVNAH